MTAALAPDVLEAELLQPASGSHATSRPQGDPAWPTHPECCPRATTGVDRMHRPGTNLHQRAPAARPELEHGIADEDCLRAAVLARGDERREGGEGAEVIDLEIFHVDADAE